MELASAGGADAESAAMDGGADVTIDQLPALRERGVRLIDIREDQEVADGMLAGAEHIPTGTLDIIDNYIDDREKDVETGRMSRSDFINEAVNRYLVELGLVEPESNTEVTPK